MNIKTRMIFALLIPIALTFGFLHLFIGRTEYNFERLHIFLFNLCSGGTILLYYTEKLKITKKVVVFFLLAVGYALLAFLEHYIPAMLVSVALAIIVEFERIGAFSVFPSDFFSRTVPTYRKFHQASLLCLSIGLVLSSLVILNNKYLHLVYMPKLTLNTFFLGFSFPVSLITMSLMFSLMEKQAGKVAECLKEAGFWAVNVGVVVFFLFIIFEKLVPQLIVTAVLFCAVITIYLLFYRLGSRLQQKAFLISGMGFLLVTAVTGILYIILEFTPAYSTETTTWLLKLHTFASLYGWNLCGLVIICRHDDFPIELNSKAVIAFHWIAVIMLAPLGSFFRPMAVCAVVCFGVILSVMLFSQGSVRVMDP
ncbi:MAG: hypothetical protein GY866_19680 [Proteobacteria bacterium]|nr:hypothetical protein [Pseudomonadota bacterium]